MKRLFKSKATEPTPYPINQPQHFVPQQPSLPAPYPPPTSAPGNRSYNPGSTQQQPVEYHPTHQQSNPPHPSSPNSGAVPPRRRDKLFNKEKDGVTPFPSDISQEIGFGSDRQAPGRGGGAGGGKERRARDVVGNLGRGQAPDPEGGPSGGMQRRTSLKSKGEGIFGNWGKDRKDKQTEKQNEKERAARQAGMTSPLPGQEYPRYSLQDQSQSPEFAQHPTFQYQDPRTRLRGQSDPPYLDPSTNAYLARPPQPTPSPDPSLPNPFTAPRTTFYDNDRANSSAESYAQLAPATPPANTKPQPPPPPPPNGMANIRLYPPPIIKADPGNWSPNSSDEFHSQQQTGQQQRMQYQHQQHGTSPSRDVGLLSASPLKSPTGQFTGSNGPMGGTGWQGSLAATQGYETHDSRTEHQTHSNAPPQPRVIPFLQPRKAPVPPPSSLAVSRSPNATDVGMAYLGGAKSPPLPPRTNSGNGTSPRPSYDIERALGPTIGQTTNKLQRSKSPNVLGGQVDGENGQKEKKGFLGFKTKEKDQKHKDNQGGYEEFDPSTGEPIVPVRSKEALKGEKQRAKVLEKQLPSSGTPANSVTSAITTLCSRAYASDLPEISNLLQRIDESPEDVAKEAARAVRKEIKYGKTDAERVFGMKVWLLGCLHPLPRGHFRVQATDKRFLASIQQVLSEPPGGAGLSNDAFERLRDTLAQLNYSLGAQRGFEGLREVWIKVRTPDEPSEGRAFPSTHPVFSPSDRLLRRSSDGSLRDPPQGIQASNGPDRALVNQPSVAQFIPDETQELRRLLRECAAAQEHAAMFNGALVYATPQTLHSGSGIQDFYATCVRAQESLVSQLGWANSKAEQSRMERGVDTPAAMKQSFDLSRADMPLAEKAFDELLKANQQITEVLKIYEDLEGMARSEQELDMVKEKSKTETRGNRNLNTYEYGGESAGGSNSTTPARVPSPQPYRPSSRNEVRQPKSHDHSADGQHQYGARLDPSHATRPSTGTNDYNPLARMATPEALDPPRRLENEPRAGSPTRKVLGPRPLSDLRRGKHGSDSSLNGSAGTHRPNGGQRHMGDLAGDESETDDDLLMAPVRPSAKALGKRKVVERDEESNTFDPDDMWKAGDPRPPSSASSSEEDLLHPLHVYKKPIKYLYDAAVERESQRKDQRQFRRHGSSSQSMSNAVVRAPGVGGSSGEHFGEGEEAVVAEPDEVLAMPGAGGGSVALQYAADALKQPSGLKHAPSVKWKPWKRT